MQTDDRPPRARGYAAPPSVESEEHSMVRIEELDVVDTWLGAA